MSFRAGCSDELALLGELAGLDEQTSPGELTCAILSPGLEKSPLSRDFLFLIYTRPYSRVRKVNSQECPFFAQPNSRLDQAGFRPGGPARVLK
ncbi:hypothetical protein AtEden1_Chr3g0191811 [Arabidopsis thaliana]